VIAEVISSTGELMVLRTAGTKKLGTDTRCAGLVGVFAA